MMPKLLSILVVLLITTSSWAWIGKVQFNKEGSDGIAILESDSNTVCLSTVGKVEITDNYFATDCSMCASNLYLNGLSLTPNQTKEEAIKMMEDNDFKLIES